MKMTATALPITAALVTAATVVTMAAPEPAHRAEKPAQPLAPAGTAATTQGLLGDDVPALVHNVIVFLTATRRDSTDLTSATPAASARIQHRRQQ
jgi:hypothetical protein